MTSFAGFQMAPRPQPKLLVDTALERLQKTGGYTEITPAIFGLITDTNLAAFFDQELEHIKAKSYDILRRELKHREYIPVSFEAGPGAETISYTQYDQVGTAKLIRNYGEDLPLANIKGRKFTSNVAGIGIGYKYSLQDIRASMMANKRLTDREAAASMRSNKEKEESLAAFGASGLFSGFLNHANITIVQAADIGGGERRWIAGGKTADQINADVSLMVRTIIAATNDVEHPNTLLMPASEYVHVSALRLGDTSETFLSWMLRTNPWIKNIGVWDLLKTADAGGDGPRLVCYDRSPDKVTLEIPQDFEMLPPQPEGLTFLVPCHSRFGGVLYYYPLSACYMDDLG